MPLKRSKPLSGVPISTEDRSGRTDDPTPVSDDFTRDTIRDRIVLPNLGRSRLKYDPERLRDRQRAFAATFVLDYNATNAAIRIGSMHRKLGTDPSLNGYSSRAQAAIAGTQMLNTPAVRKLIRQYQQEQLRNSFITNERIKSEFAKLAFSNILHYVKPVGDGYILKYSDFDKIDGSAIQSIEPTKDGQVKIKLHPKIDPLVKLAAMHGMFERDNEQRRPVIVVGEEGIIDDDDDDNDGDLSIENNNNE